MKLISKHLSFNKSVKERHIEFVRKELVDCNPRLPELIFKALVEGFDKPEERPRPSEYLGA